MRIIACKVKMFDKNQDTYLIDLDTKRTEALKTIPVNDLSNSLLALSETNGADQINLYGAESYLAPIKTKMEEQAATQYGKKVKVTINEQISD